MDTQTLFQEAIKFATTKHVAMEQIVPGTDLPYVVLLTNVAIEVIMASFKTFMITHLVRLNSLDLK